MNAVASITYDRDYYDAFYTAWVAYRSRWRRFAMPLAFSFVAVTAIGLLVMPFLATAWGLFGIAILNLIDATTHRLRWVRKRLASVAVDKTARLTFTDKNIQISSPNSEGTLSYNAFGLVSLTPHGIFLIPDSGVSIFIPRSAFAADEEFRRVSSKLAEHVAQNAG